MMFLPIALQESEITHPVMSQAEIAAYNHGLNVKMRPQFIEKCARRQRCYFRCEVNDNIVRDLTVALRQRQLFFQRRQAFQVNGRSHYE